MASLLSFIKASGQPTTLTDEENEALQAQQEADAANAAQQQSGVNCGATIRMRDARQSS